MDVKDDFNCVVEPHGEDEKKGVTKAIVVDMSLGDKRFFRSGNGLLDFIENVKVEVIELGW